MTAFNSVAAHQMCTVDETRTWRRLTPGGAETCMFRELSCDDGRTHSLGFRIAVQNGTGTTDQYEGERLLVSYDPCGTLLSPAPEEQRAGRGAQASGCA